MPTVTNATILTQRFESTQATGVSPLVVASTTVVANLNADLLDGLHAAAFATVAHPHAAADVTSGTFASARISEAGVTQHQAALALATSQITSGTLADARVAASNVTQHQAALSVATSQLTGTLADARVAASNVTQHEAALAIAWSQITGEPDFISEAEADLLYLALGGGTLTGALLGTSLSMSGAAAIATHVELTNASTPSNPAATKARIFWDNTAGAVKAVNSAGTVITLGTIGGAITDAYSAVAGDSGTASASGGAQLSVLGAGGITTAAADGTPDTLTITLGNHSAALLTTGTLPDARIQATGVTQHQAALSIATTQLTGNLAIARFNSGTGASATTFWRGDGTWVAPATGLTFKGAQAYKSGGTQVINDTTFTKITYETEVFDTEGAFASSTYTVPIAGKWRVYGQLSFAAAATGLKRVNLYKNGAIVPSYNIADEGGTNASRQPFMFLIDCALNDTLEIYAYQTSGASMNSFNDSVVNFEFAGT